MSKRGFPQYTPTKPRRFRCEQDAETAHLAVGVYLDILDYRQSVRLTKYCDAYRPPWSIKMQIRRPDKADGSAI
ncbi:MAG: hypothetical protein IJY70_04730 [Clostridia bacterium]|nr:hypothetical protein [Clostridia bacterium]